jgi:predicted amidohydrolase YtcJ
VLIRDARVGFDERRVDVRLRGDRIDAVAPRLSARPGERVIEAAGAALLPGLNDHHLHLHATAAALQSVGCGPPQVRDAAQLAFAIASAPPTADGWIRATGYHESVAGPLDRSGLDAMAPDRPLRLQHRTGRLWIFNSLGLSRLGVRDAHAGDDPLERVDGRLTGRLYDADRWLRTRLGDGSRRPDLRGLSTALARRGVTGLTDTSHANDREALTDFARRDDLFQHLVVMGDASLDAAGAPVGASRVQRGAHKFHLHDHDLPDFDGLCEAIRRSHAAGRAAAFHCVTRGELVYALAALEHAGPSGRDRIEHAGVAPVETLGTMARLGVRVVTQPHFIQERGDDYRREVAAEDRPHLYRLRSLVDAGIPLAAGSDAPYGGWDPWASMAAATRRRTREGHLLGEAERLEPEQALALYLSPLEDPGAGARRVEAGARADLCLLDRAWRDARTALDQVGVRATWIAGRLHRDGQPDPEATAPGASDVLRKQ